MTPTKTGSRMHSGVHFSNLVRDLLTLYALFALHRGHDLPLAEDVLREDEAFNGERAP
jgi:hypothetical protein